MRTPPTDFDIDLLDSILLEAIKSTYRRCRSRQSAPIPLFSDLAGELAHWQDRDRNQKINDMARLSSSAKLQGLDQTMAPTPCSSIGIRPTIALDNAWLYFRMSRS